MFHIAYNSLLMLNMSLISRCSIEVYIFGFSSNLMWNTSRVSLMLIKNLSIKLKGLPLAINIGIPIEQKEPFLKPKALAYFKFTAGCSVCYYRKLISMGIYKPEMTHVECEITYI